MFRLCRLWLGAVASLIVLQCFGVAQFVATCSAEELRDASWGGIVSEANRKAYWEPYAARSGIKIIDDTFNGEFAKVRAQVEAHSYQWDIAELEDQDAAIGCDEGILEKLDKTRLPMADFMPGTIMDCGFVSAAGGVGLTYNKKKYQSGPQTWADFFDTKKFPGKRGLRKTATNTLEVALMGAGVRLADVYKVLATKEGQDLAFQELSKIKPDIVWWSSGTEQIQGFVSGEYDMGVAYNGRVAAADKTQGQDLEFVWSAGHLLTNNLWTILKGSPNSKAAMDFLSFAATPEPQAAWMRIIDYGVSNKKAYALMEPKDLLYKPNTPERAPYGLAPNPSFWRDNLDLLTERFNTWVSQ